MITDVELLELIPKTDLRGSLTELYTRGQRIQLDLPQWNLVRSEARVLRGMHAHLWYDEYYVPLSGPMLLNLVDIRPDSTSFRETMSLQWDGEPLAIRVPKGVAHGVYSHRAYQLFYGLSQPFDGDGEFGCRFDDAELGISWPTQNPILSKRDQQAGSYRELLARYGHAVETARHE